MKLATFHGDGNGLRIGCVEGGWIVDLAMAAGAFGLEFPFRDMAELLAHPEGIRLARQAADRARDREGPWRLALASVRLAAPVPRPGKIVGVATNYRDFCERANLPLPDRLKLFTKVSTTVCGPMDPVFVPDGRKVTYEGELGVVIGRKGKRIQEEEALEFVAGYLVVNDFTANDWVREDVQLMRGKNLDTFCPMGPWLVTRDEIPDPGRLSLVTKLNGRIVQQSDTSNLVFGVPNIIHQLSAFMTLEPGDVIATGTPAGTALQHEPPAFVRHGDLVEVTVEGIGTLQNPILRAVEDVR